MMSIASWWLCKIMENQDTMTLGASAFGSVALWAQMIAVQDRGEPGTIDTWRIRILDKDTGYVLFDSDYRKGYIFDIDPYCGDPDFIEDCSAVDPDFDGTYTASRTGKNGGGNIQVHCKGGPGWQTTDPDDCQPILPGLTYTTPPFSGTLDPTGPPVVTTIPPVTPDPCVTVEEHDFGNGKGSWAITSTAEIRTTPYGSAWLGKTGVVTRDFTNEVVTSGSVPYTKVKVTFSVCYFSLEAQHDDRFHLEVDLGSGFTNVETYEAGDNLTAGSLNCMDDVSEDIIVPAGSSELQIRFVGDNSHQSNDDVWITKVTTKGCNE